MTAPAAELKAVAPLDHRFGSGPEYLLGWRRSSCSSTPRPTRSRRPSTGCWPSRRRRRTSSPSSCRASWRSRPRPRARPPSCSRSSPSCGPPWCAPRRCRACASSQPGRIPSRWPRPSRSRSATATASWPPRCATRCAGACAAGCTCTSPWRVRTRPSRCWSSSCRTCRCCWRCRPRARSGAATTPAWRRRARRSSSPCRGAACRRPSRTTRTSRSSSRRCASRARCRTTRGCGGTPVRIRAGARSRCASWTPSRPSRTPRRSPPWCRRWSATSARPTTAASAVRRPRGPSSRRTAGWPRATGCTRRSSTPSRSTPSPAREALRRLLERLADDADALDAGWAFARLARLEDTSADRQRRLHRRGATLPQVLAHLVDETAARP